VTPGRFPSVDLSFLRQRDVLVRIGAVTLAFALVGVAYALFAPRSYKSQMTVVPATTSRSTGIASLLGGELGGMSGLGGIGVGGADLGRIAAVLQSTSVADAVIERSGLKQRTGVKLQEAARDLFWGMCDVKIVPKSSTLVVACEDGDPAFAQSLLATLGEVGNQAFRRVTSSSASEEVRYLERRTAELTAAADEAARRMKEFQEKHQIVDLDSQARAVVSSAAVLHGQLINKRMELDYTREFASSDDPGTRQLESQLSVVEESLRDLEQPRKAGRGAAGGAGVGDGGGMFPAALSVPKLRAEFEKLARDRRVAEATVVLSYDRLEAARAAEARDVSTFQVLDPPTLPTRKSRPRGLVSVVTAAALGFTLSLLVELWRARKRVQAGA
jgi:tyrosine-protein kinase Etk/Wzc